MNKSRDILKEMSIFRRETNFYRNQIFCADNHEIFPRIPAGSVDLVLTDPPYKDYQSNRPLVHPKQKEMKRCDFDLPFFVEQSFRVLKDGAHFYCFCDHKTFPEIKLEVDKYFTYKNCLIWVKNNHGSGDLKGDWAPQHEFIIFAAKGKGRNLNPPRRSNVLHFPKVPNEKFSHGTVKPVQLLQVLIEASTNIDDLVLDPYAGVMSTAVACVNTGRAYLMIEIELDFFQVGESRIQDIREMELETKPG
jgi:site-specific DNA-methyltransferase (adenine-specific)